MSEAIEQVEWLRPQEVAERLGLARRTIYQLTYLKKIPPDYVRKIDRYYGWTLINWTAIKDVPRKKPYGYDWAALQPEHQ